MSCKVTSTLQYLNSPELTARIQSYFGVEVLPDEKGKGGNDNSPPIKKYDFKHDKYNPTAPSPSSIASPSYRIHNRLAYWIFKFGCFLGQEEFYLSIFPLWFWNFDGAAGPSRKIVIIWALSLYIGQFLKDYLRWPRPSSPPVVYLERQYLLEYGMPSTHSVVGICIPFVLAYFQDQRCQIPFFVHCIYVSTHTTLVCSSRLYVGVHTVLQVLAGIALASLLIAFYLPLAPILEEWLMLSMFSPLAITAVCFTACVILPNRGPRWTQPWSGTVAIVSVCAGTITGCWLGLRTGVWTWTDACTMKFIQLDELPIVLIRTILGIIVALVTRLCVRPIYYTFAGAYYGLTRNDVKMQRWPIVELPACFLTYFIIAFNVSFLMPNIFSWLGLSH